MDLHPPGPDVRVQGSEFKEMGIKGEAQVAFEDGKGKEYTLKEGDGAYIKEGKVGDGLVLKSTGGRDAELVLFDLRPSQGSDW